MSVITDSSRLEQAAPSGGDDRAALGAAIHEAAATADASDPQELYALARSAIVAGDYETAHALALRIPEHDGVRTVIGPILNLVPAARSTAMVAAAGAPSVAPELPYPENFYTYHRDFYPLDVLNDVQRQIAAVAQPPRDASQAYSGFADRGMMFIRAAVTWFEALKHWQSGTAAFSGRNYAAAQTAYDACQAAICDYFSKYLPDRSRHRPPQRAAEQVDRAPSPGPGVLGAAVDPAAPAPRVAHPPGTVGARLSGAAARALYRT